MEIPSSVNDIWNGAFSSCTSLKRVTMPNTMKLISKHAFEGCTSLKVLTIPKSVTEIEEEAFEGCSSLTLRIPRSSKHARNPTYYCCRFVCTYAYAIICLVTAPFKGSKLCDLDIPGLEVGEVKWKDCTLHICVRQLLRVDFLKNF